MKIPETVEKSVLDVLRSGWLSPGKKVEQFENAVARKHKAKYGVMVNSGTDALRIALLALKEKYGWQDGDLVMVPGVTFVATVNTVIQAGLKPELVDVSMYDWNLNPDNLERRLETLPNTKKIKAVIPVHVAGNPCNMTRIMELARKYNLKFIEDSCECIGVDGIAKADITCFSFYAAHILTTGVGGMAITNDRDLKELMWSYANHGREQAGEFTFKRIGYSSRATELEAAIGLESLITLDSAIQKRRENAERLCNGLSDVDGIRVYFSTHSAFMFFPIVISESSMMDRDSLLKYLKQNQIECRKLLPLLRQPCYEGRWNPNEFGISDWVNKNGFYIGCHEYLDNETIDRTIDVLRRAFSAPPLTKTKSRVE